MQKMQIFAYNLWGGGIGTSLCFLSCFSCADSHICIILFYFLFSLLMDLEKAISQFFAWFGQSVRKSLKIAALLLVIYILSSSAWFIVEPGERWLIVRLGTLVNTTYDEGFHFKVPFITNAVMMNVQTQKAEVTADSASKDLQVVTTVIAVNYNLEPAAVRSLYQTIGKDEVIAFKIIAPSIQEAVKSTTAKFTAEELITERTAVAIDIKANLTNKLGKLGILVSDINIVEFRFSPEFDAAIESKVKAEQDALAQKNLLEKVKYEAQQKIETAKAEAESIRIQAEAVRSQWGADYVKLKWIEKWSGALPTTTLGEQGFIVNLNN